MQLRSRNNSPYARTHQLVAVLQLSVKSQQNICQNGQWGTHTLYTLWWPDSDHATRLWTRYQVIPLQLHSSTTYPCVYTIYYNIPTGRCTFWIINKLPSTNRIPLHPLSTSVPAYPYCSYVCVHMYVHTYMFVFLWTACVPMNRGRGNGTSPR